jgi:dinuclear metal center YbgI/SA1388 family protein
MLIEGVDRVSFLTFLNDLLCPGTHGKIKDYCPNGLQIEGKKNIKKLVTGVSASHALIEQACQLSADALLVHHGFFWKQENPCLTGWKYERIRLLIEAKINLIAYHLPLDLHAELGNNAQLALRLGINLRKRYPLFEVDALGCVGELKETCTPEKFAIQLEKVLDRKPLHLGSTKGAKEIKTVAWCTGAAQEGLEWAANLGVDAYLSGEVSERTSYLAQELGVHYFACGHHATERYGVQAVGEYCAKHFGISHQFIEIGNPV